jgi:hypothetical protein
MYSKDMIGPPTYNQWRQRRYMENESPERRAVRLEKRGVYDEENKDRRRANARVYRARKRAEARALRPPKPEKERRLTREQDLIRRHEIADFRFPHWARGCETQEEAYWLGFIVADGNVFEDRVKVGLWRPDRPHLLALQEWCGGGSVVDPPSKPNGVVFSVSSVALARRLAKLGVVPDKHFKTQFPEIPRRLWPHFIRGVFDGDGCIRLTTKGQWRWNITGNPPLLRSIQAVFYAEHLIKKLNKLSSIAKNGVTCRFECEGDQQVTRIMGYLYRDATVWLARKRVLWETRKVLDRQELHEVRRQAGIKGGKARARVLSAEELSEIGRKGAEARHY